MLEFQTFNAMWDRTMKEYEERALELLEAMRQRHELDARELRAKSMAAPSSVKQSPKLLDLRRSERALAKQGEYADAHRVKLEAAKLESEEWQRAMVDREQQLVKAEAAFLTRQENELQALRQRIQAGAEEQRVARQQDLERLLRRYQNIKTELESQQRAELNRQKRGLPSSRPNSARGNLSSRVPALPAPATSVARSRGPS